MQNCFWFFSAARSYLSFKHFNIFRYRFSLTTVQIPCNSVAHMMFKMLTDKQSGERNSTEYVIDTEVVIRESSGPFQGGSLLPRHVK
jgi:DNA-binding LacI/PurR family transcriptional regulator